MIGSQIIQIVKNKEGRNRRLKIRLFPHGNRSWEKGQIRSDCAHGRFDVVRLMLYVSNVLRLTLGCSDVQGAYLQSGPIKREVYIRPSREWVHRRGHVWTLNTLTYGIFEAGRQWVKTIWQWLKKVLGSKECMPLASYTSEPI